MFEILRLVQAAPSITKLYAAVTRAKEGDLEALEYLKREGWADALDCFRPGAGRVGREVLQHVQEARRNITQSLNGNVIEGEAHELPPWYRFVKRLFAQPNSAHIILGPTGSGKTTLALRLAQRLSEEQGYAVEFCNLYGDDLPAFGSTIQIETLVARMRRLSKYLKSQIIEDEEDEDEERAAKSAEPQIATMPPRRRVIVIDEAILAMTTNASDPGRKAALQSLAQCRHLQWHVIFVGQWCGQLPLPLIGQAVLWVKQPNGREALTDRDHPVVRNLWERAEEGFARLKDSPWYPEYPHPKSWAYVDCEALNGNAGYSGMAAFTPVSTIVEGEYKEVED